MGKSESKFTICDLLSDSNHHSNERSPIRVSRHPKQKYRDRYRGRNPTGTRRGRKLASDSRTLRTTQQSDHAAMGLSISKLYDMLNFSVKTRILMLGLDAAGKTTGAPIATPCRFHRLRPL